MTRPGTELRFPAPLANTLPTRPMETEPFIYIKMDLSSDDPYNAQYAIKANQTNQKTNSSNIIKNQLYNHFNLIVESL